MRGRAPAREARHNPSVEVDGDLVQPVDVVIALSHHEEWTETSITAILQGGGGVAPVSACGPSSAASA